MQHLVKASWFVITTTDFGSCPSRWYFGGWSASPDNLGAALPGKLRMEMAQGIIDLIPRHMHLLQLVSLARLLRISTYCRPRPYRSGTSVWTQIPFPWCAQLPRYFVQLNHYHLPKCFIPVCPSHRGGQTRLAMLTRQRVDRTVSAQTKKI